MKVFAPAKVGALIRIAFAGLRELCLAKAVSLLTLLFLQKLTGDHELLDLGGAFVDA